MGKVDTVTKKYLRQSSVFADIFNFYLYEGRQVINPEQLRELDPAELSVPYGADQRGEPVQRYRDLFKALSAMEDQRAAYLLLGIESQDEVHYAAPVRNLLYDALQYARQVDETARIHREKKDYKGRSRGEFLSGFYKEDKLLPVITLVVFFSPQEWDGPRSLREMMATEDTAIRSLLPDYQVHLISPAELSRTDLGKFHTSLGDVLGFIKYSTDKENLMEWFRGERQDAVLGRNEVDVLNTCVNADLKIQPNEEGVTMCQAILEWKADLKEDLRKEITPILRAELRETVTEEVTQEVTEQVTQQVTEQVTQQVTEQVTQQVTEQVTQQVTEQVTQQVTEHIHLTDLKNLMCNLQITAEQAGAALGISKEELAQLIQKL